MVRPSSRSISAANPGRSESAQWSSLTMIANVAQDGMRIEQAASGTFEVPVRDTVTHARAGKLPPIPKDPKIVGPV